MTSGNFPEVFILHIYAHKYNTTAAQRNFERFTIESKEGTTDNSRSLYLFWRPIMGAEELKLISFGFPLSEAIGMVYRLRRDGKLEEFIAEQEKQYKQDCEKLAAEMLG